jgi:hypothetical protein
MTPDRSPLTYAATVDHQARYQLLDYAAEDSPLWDAPCALTIYPGDGRRIDRHRERPPEELRAELEQLLREGYVELYEMTRRAPRILSPDEAVSVAADDRNWYAPKAPGELPERRIYALSLTDSGEEEYRRECARANQR